MIPSLDHLTLDSTLGDLPLHQTSVPQQTPSRVIAQLFERNTGLPGVFIEDHPDNLYFISRQGFHTHLNDSSDREIFLSSPIAILFVMSPETDRLHNLVLPHREHIHTAVQKGLSRSFRCAYDPIVVIAEDPHRPGVPIPSLLDFHTLLLAQTALLSHTYQEHLKQKHDALWDGEQEPQAFMVQSQAIVESQTIAQLNQQLLNVRKLLSGMGQQTFQATFGEIQSLCRTSEAMVEVGNALRNELNTIGNISKSIAKISRQVHHLSVKASIIISQSTIANSPNDSLAGFSTVNEEIGNLVSQTFDAGRQIEQVSTEFRQRIEAFVHAAQEGMREARSVAALAEQAQIVLDRLEAAVNHLP